jgi:hypothetical protein
MDEWTHFWQDRQTPGTIGMPQHPDEWTHFWQDRQTVER